MGDVSLSIIIVSWNTCAITRDCLRSVRKMVHEIGYEVIVVDNGSSDGSAEMIRSEFPDVHLIGNPDNVGFGRANNQAMRTARGCYFLLLNSDTLILDDSVQRLVAFANQDAAIGITGCKLLFGDLTLQYSCYRFPSIRLGLVEELGLYKLLPRHQQGELLLAGYWSHDHARDVDWILGAAMLVRRETFEQTGGFDERIFMYGEEMEWCMRVSDQRWRITFTPDSRIVHLNHKSAEIKYGDRRIDLCNQRLFEIYGRRSGRPAEFMLLVLKTVGSLIRFCYFGLRALPRSDRHDYFHDQANFYGRILKYNLRALGGMRLVIE